MTGAALVQGDTLLPRAPIELRVEDRLPTAPIHRLTAATLAVAAGSLLVHIGLMAGALVVARAPLAIAPDKEIAVEVVQEAPTPVAEASKPPEPKVEQVKAEPPKAAPPKVEAAKVEQPPPKPAPPPAQKAEADDGRVKQLQDELASLRAEQAALKAEANPGSGKAVALANATDGDGEMVDYQLLVFSQLAKAKEQTTFKGGIGTTGVKFLIDDKGALARAEVTMSSGDAALDREALAIVSRAAPFPPPPKDADRLVFANVNFVASK